MTFAPRLHSRSNIIDVYRVTFLLQSVLAILVMPHIGYCIISATEEKPSLSSASVSMKIIQFVSKFKATISLSVCQFICLCRHILMAFIILNLRAALCRTLTII